MLVREDLVPIALVLLADQIFQDRNARLDIRAEHLRRRTTSAPHENPALIHSHVDDDRGAVVRGGSDEQVSRQFHVDGSIAVPLLLFLQYRKPCIPVRLVSSSRLTPPLPWRS